MSCVLVIFQLSRKLRTSSQEVGTSLISLIRTTGQVQADPFDEVLRSRALPECEKYFQEKIALLLSHLQIGLKGIILLHIVTLCLLLGKSDEYDY